MSQTLQNQIINAKSMNGVMSLSDGVAVLENGSLTNVDNIETDSINTQSFSTNDFIVNTNIDLTGDTSKLQFTFPPSSVQTNTLIERRKVTAENFQYQDFKILGQNIIFNTALGSNLTLVKPLPDCVTIFNAVSRTIFLPLITDLLGTLNKGGSSITFIRTTAVDITIQCAGTNQLEFLDGSNATSFFWSDDTFSNVITLYYNKIGAGINRWFVSPIFGTGSSSHLDVPLLYQNNNFTAIQTFLDSLSIYRNINFPLSELKLIDETVLTSGNLPPIKAIGFDNISSTFKDVFSIQPYAIDVPTNIGGLRFLSNSVNLLDINGDTQNINSGCDINMNSNDILNVNNINLTTINGVAPGGAQNLSSVLSIGNSAGTRNIDMSGNNILNCNNINLTTINGTAYPPTSSIPTLSSVLSIGNSAGTNNINMNSNNILNANEIDIVKTTTGIGNPAIDITTNATGSAAANLVVNRFSTAPTANDDLFAINVNGRDSVGSSVEYTRISTHTIDPSSGIQTARLSFFARGGTLPMSNYEVMTLQNSLIQLNKPTRCFSGFHQAHKTFTLTANTNFSSAWSEWVGSHMYINQTTNGWTMTLGLATNFQGSISWIRNVSSFILTLSVASGSFGGSYGTGTTTIQVSVGQTLMLVGNGTSWDICDVLGVKYMMFRYHNTTQGTASGATVAALFNTAGAKLDSGNTAWCLDTWNGTQLTYNVGNGTFTNNTGSTMNLNVQCKIHCPTNTNRYAGVNKLATRYDEGTLIMWYNSLTSSTNIIPCGDNFILKNGEAFNIQIQSGAAGTWSSTISNLFNRISITRH
jgi:hypothetical protein